MTYEAGFLRKKKPNGNPEWDAMDENASPSCIYVLSNEDV
jgi:hypothetical protein